MRESWRLFVAVPIDEALRSALRQATVAWRARPDLARLRWTDPEHWHLTLAFIGASDPVDVPAIADALRSVGRRHAARRLATGGLGAFPSRTRATVAWYGVQDPDALLDALAADVAPAVGVEPKGRFRPHITLARVKEPTDLRRWLEEAVVPAGALAVDRMELMRSHLGAGPARYQQLATVPIGMADDG